MQLDGSHHVDATVPDRVDRAPSFVQDAIHNGRTASSDDSFFILPPDEQRWDPFLILVDDRFSDAGFPWHPHRGFQTLTFVLDGRLEHRDNAGGFGVLGPGDAQYMIAGRYALHYELAHLKQPVHTLQMWINLPADKKLGDSGYFDLRADAATVIEQDGVLARLHVGTVGEHQGADPTRFLVPLSLIDIRLDAGARFVHELPGDHVAALYVVNGAVRVGPEGQPLTAKQVAWFEEGRGGPTELLIEADADTQAIVYSGQPIGETVAFGGPFVMNTAAEVQQAYADLRAGRFGPVPSGDPVA